ncbi:MAG: tetratricopeptide repeat protein, partial [Candidatus Kariarchaeaceae archaeon]
LQLFTTMKNNKGIGICYNNIGNIQNALGRLKEANISYQKAIDIANSLLKESNSEEQKIENTLSLASRTNNVAMLFNKIDRNDEAEELLQNALKLDKEIDNKKGFSTRYGNLGLVYLSSNKFEAAKNAFYKALEIANEIESNRSIAYAKMNLGTYHRTIGEIENAKEFLLSATDLASELDVRVVFTSLSNLKEIYDNEGEYELASEIDKKLVASQRQRVVPRDIIFVLDYSGSMAGRRIKDAREGIANIYLNQVQDNDVISIISFNYNIDIPLQAKLKQELGDSFFYLLDRFVRPNGGTAMYDAMRTALEMLQYSDPENEKWVIVLTDGDDNSSKSGSSGSIIKLASRLPDTNLVIIGVGELKRDRNKLQKIAKSLTNGVFIGIEAGVANAITEAFEEVGTMLAEVDVEGFVPDY